VRAVFAIDPGASPGFALIDLDTPVPTQGRAAMPRYAILAMGNELQTTLTPHFDDLSGGFVCIVEYQYTGRVTNHEISARSVVRLALRAGLAAGQALTLGATHCHAVIPQVWKSALVRGMGQVRKEICTNRIRANLLPQECEQLAVFPKAMQADILDAIGLAWSYGRLTPDQLAKTKIDFAQWPRVYDGIDPVGSPSYRTQRRRAC
jgi:hypothetical protein